MNLIRIFILLPLLIALISCEPIRLTTKVKPFDIEPPKETPLVKKLPHEALVILDDSQIKKREHLDYMSNIIYEVEFPSGYLLKQVLPIFFDNLFTKTKYTNKQPMIVSQGTLLITSNVDTLNFTRKCCPELLEVNVYTKFNIYDSDILPLTLPIISFNSEKMSKPGLFSYIDEKDYGMTAYKAIFNSLKTATDTIFESLSNQKAEILRAKNLINQDPSNALAYKVVANLSLKNNDIAEALAASQMILKLYPNDVDGYILLYKTYLAQRKYKEALAQIEKAMSLSPKRPDLTKKLSEFYISRGKFDKALEMTKKYLEQRPDDIYLPLQLAMLYFKIGKYDESIKISEKATANLIISGIGAAISKTEGTYAKVISVEPNGPAEKAGIKTNYEIIEIDGQSTLEMKLNDIVQKLRGQEGTSVNLKVKKSESDDTHTFKLIRTKFYADPIVASYKSLIALSYIELNDKVSAKRYIDEAEKIAPQEQLVKLTKSTFYLYDRQYEKVFIELSSIKEDNYAKILQAIANAKLGNFDESLNLYSSTGESLLITKKTKNELFIAINPYLEKIENRAMEYERLGQFSKAFREYYRLIQFSEPEKAQKIRSRIARIIASNPSLIELKDEARKHFLNAEVLFTNNKLEEAINELEKASEYQPFNPQIYFNKAVVYEKLSDYAKAIENMEIYLQLNPNAPNGQTIRDQIHKWRFILEKEL